VHQPVIHCIVIMLHATQKIVAMELAKAADSNQVWFFNNLSNHKFNKKISPFNILTIQLKYFFLMEFMYVNFALLMHITYMYFTYSMLFSKCLGYSHEYSVVHL